MDRNAISGLLQAYDRVDTQLMWREGARIFHKDDKRKW